MRVKLMGVVNVTPDSFSDGGLYLEPEAAIAHGSELADEGADILDVGGESTRPGAEEVGVEAEVARTEPVVSDLAALGHTVSIDTSKLAVAEAALDAGAGIVNDVTALRADPEIAALCADRGATLALMHMQGDPRTMQENPVYEDVVDDVKAFLAGRIELALAAGVDEGRIWVDPGIGFGKTLDHNLELLRRLGELRDLGRPILVGTSRKSFIGKVDGSGPDRRIGGTIASSVLAAAEGADVLRVHDVAEAAQATQGRRRDPGIVSRSGGSRKRDRVERRGRAAQPLDLHPPWGERGRAGDRAAARVRRLLRCSRLRRGPHRPARGHGRLRGGLRHRRPRGDRAQLPDARAPRPGRRPAADGALQLRLGPRPRLEARAAAAARDPGGRGRGRPGPNGKREDEEAE